MKRLMIPLFGGLILGLFIIGCSGSTEQTTRTSSAPSGRKGEQFVTKRDTVEVNIIPSAKIDTQTIAIHDSMTVRPRTDSTSSKPHIFTIQLGAFESEANAHRCEDQAKDTLRMPTYIEYDHRNRQFRVTIGTFSTREAAFEVLKELKQHYTPLYRDAWVAESLRNQQ